MGWLMELSSSSDKVSSKRVITLISFALMATAFIADLFFGYEISEFIYNSMSYIVIAGLGFTAAEWLGNGKVKGTPAAPVQTVIEQDGGGFDKGYSRGYQQAKDDAVNGKLIRVQNLPNSNPYERGYREGYQAAKEEHLSGNNETEEEMR